MKFYKKVNKPYIPASVLGIREEGGEIVQGEPEGVEQDPMMQILEMAAQATQSSDCELGLQVCTVLVEMAQGGAPGGEEAPAEEMAKGGMYDEDYA